MLKSVNNRQKDSNLKPKSEKNRSKNYITIISTTIIISMFLSTNIIVFAAVTPFFEDDFESGNFNAWNNTYDSYGESIRITSANKHSGNYGAEFTTNGNGGYEYAQTQKAVSSMSELYARAYIKIANEGLSSTGDKIYFIRFSAGSNNVLWAGLRQSGSYIRWHLMIRDGSSYTSKSSDFSPNLNEWYSIEAYWRNDGRYGKSTLWINGEEILSITSKDTNNYGNVNEVQFGIAEAYSISSSKIFGDNFAISNEYIGGVGQTSSSSSGDTFESGNFEQWTGSETTYGESTTVSTYNPYQGNYHARFATNGNSGTEHAYIYQTVNENTVYVSGFFNFIQGLPLNDQSDRFYLIRFRANDQSVAGLGIRKDNSQMKWSAYSRDGSGWEWPTYLSNPNIEMNQWYKIELLWKQSSYQGQVEVKINDQKIFEITGVNTAYYGNVDNIQIGIVNAVSNQDNLIIYADNLIVEAQQADQSDDNPNDEPNPTPNKDVHFGWGGYITSTRDVVPILEDLQNDGYNAIRYWARPYWYYRSSYHSLDYNVLDLLVDEALKREITVYIDCEHNYPPEDFINSYNRYTWINDVIKVGLRYKNYNNVVLEPINEYTGNDQISLYNWGMAKIRQAGIHLPLLWNFWWNQPNAALNDPDNNYAIGRHLYGGGYTSYDPYYTSSLEYAVDKSGIDNSMYRYFDDPRQSLYLQSVLDLKIPNGWIISEMGPAQSGSGIEDPSVGNIAYAMQFLREAAKHDVSVICYRIGDISLKSLYESRARKYFNKEFFIPP